MLKSVIGKMLNGIAGLGLLVLVIWPIVAGNWLAGTEPE